MHAQQQQRGTLTSEDIRQILEAIQSTPEWQFLNLLMTQHKLPADRAKTRQVARQLEELGLRPPGPQPLRIATPY